jgi:hypothetical protein
MSHLYTHTNVTRCFFVEDQINPGWSLVKKVDPRSEPVVYKGIPASSESEDSVANEIEIGSPRFGVDKASSEPVHQTAGLSVEFVDEEVDSQDKESGGEDEEQEYDVDSDVNLESAQAPEEVIQHPRRTFQRYIGDQVVAEESVSGSESEDYIEDEDTLGEPVDSD